MLGAYAYLGPKATRAIFELPSEKADILIGAVTVVTGVFGTITGGAQLQRTRSNSNGQQRPCYAAQIIYTHPTERLLSTGRIASQHRRPVPWSAMCCAGVMLDRIGSSIRNALLMCAGGMVIGGVCVALSFGTAAGLWQFIPLFALGEFAWFATQACFLTTILMICPR